MKWVKKILLVLLIGLIVIQFFQPARNHNSRVLSTDLAENYNVPAGVQAVLKSSCYDCHSNNTSYPWYSRIQPFAWLLAGHIKEGKAELNFSEFGTYSFRKQKSKLKAIESSINNGSMPLWTYTLIHTKAKLSGEEKKLLINWAENTRAGMVPR